MTKKFEKHCSTTQKNFERKCILFKCYASANFTPLHVIWLSSGVKRNFWPLRNFWPDIVFQLFFFSEQRKSLAITFL